MRFDPASAVYGAHTPASLGDVLADAERGGFDVEPVWIVTTMGPERATTIYASSTPGARQWIEVAIPVPLSPHSRHDWGPDAWAADDDRENPWRDAESRRMDGEILDAMQAALRDDPPAPTWSTEPPSDAERALMELLRDRPADKGP